MRSRQDIVIKALESFPNVKVIKMSGSINKIDNITLLADPASIPQRLLDAASASNGSYSIFQSVQPINVLGCRLEVAEIADYNPIVEINLNINPGFYKVLGEEVDRQVFKEMDKEADEFIEKWLSDVSSR